MKCEIIKDLLPSYIDGLTSPESNLEIKEHLNHCPQCKEIFEQMKAEVRVEHTEYNKEKIKPFKKLNRKVLKAVLITLTVCALAVVSYFYFFAFGWRVNSNDINIAYAYKDDKILFEFELTDGRVLNSWSRLDADNIDVKTITFTECFSSILDDRGEHPGKFSYGIHCTTYNGNKVQFAEDDCVILQFKDKTETFYLREIAKELNIM
ncbi:anti-sigma factor [Dehalobacter sp. TBBPA1]|uniref:anti-sigma factor family protein n=1 Tax=Dehalobacter sp. TBBPA1 TaxID=3235037 RepID=UPI0034A530F7